MRPDLQRYFAAPNAALMAMTDGTGAGPAVWCHSQLSDQHGFSNRGGWVFPLNAPPGADPAHNLAPGLLGNLRDALGAEVTVQDLFDAVLALLSAPAYAYEFAHDLEDDFPHVPIPARADVLDRAAALGARIRAVQAFEGRPKLVGLKTEGGKKGSEVCHVPGPKDAWTQDGETGSVALSEDTDLRLTGVPERAWRFAVSGYPVLYNWLKGRRGETADSALLRSLRDVVARIDQLCSLYEEADGVLRDALGETLTRDDLKLDEREGPAQEADDDEPG